MRKVKLLLVVVLAALLLGLLPCGYDTVSVPSTGAVALPRVGFNGMVVKAARVTNIGTVLIYFRVDGGAPTTSTGDTIYPGGGANLESPAEVSQFQAIAASGTGSLAVTYFQ